MKRNLIVFTAGAVTSLFVSDVIKRLEIKTSSNTMKRNPYLKFIEYGLPSIDNLEYYQQFVTSIDYARRIPHWVGYSLSRDCLSRCSFEPTSTRTRSEFNSDCQVVPKQFRATNQDYFGSGWSRGHMAPAGDHKYGSQQAMDQTFILSANIVPQDLDNNGNYWCRIEWFARELARKYDFVHIITGPLFLPKDQKQKHVDADPNFPSKEMSHSVIGHNEVHVPTHLFKCILVENNGQKDMSVGCFVVPNEPIDRNRPLTDFAVPIEDIEQRSGLQLFHRKINTNYLPFLCNETSCELTGEDRMPPETLEQVRYMRKIGRCTTLDQVNQLWNEVQQKNYKKIEKMLTTAYNKKLNQLNQNTTQSMP